MREPSRLAKAALAYAERFGWKVFPLHGKLPAIPKREGGRGYLDATTDLEQIERWWWRWPNANVGIAAGLSGLVIIDIDPRSDGDANWADLIVGREVPNTAQVFTGGSGSHLYLSGDFPSSVLAGGVEIKGGGGYVVAPPSGHASGKDYEWEALARVDETPIAPVPAWLTDMLRKKNRTGLRYEHANSVDPTTFALGAAFKAANMLGGEVKPGTFLAICPNASAHSMGEDFDGSTVVFAPPPGKVRGWFHCSHGHCTKVLA